MTTDTQRLDKILGTIKERSWVGLHYDERRPETPWTFSGTQKYWADPRGAIDALIAEGRKERR